MMFWQQGTRNLKSIHFYELFLNIEGDLSLFALSLLIWGMNERNGPLENVTGGPGQRLMTSGGDPRSLHCFPGCRRRRRKTGGCGTTTPTTRMAGDRLRPGANAIIFLLNWISLGLFYYTHSTRSALLTPILNGLTTKQYQSSLRDL